MAAAEAIVVRFARPEKFRRSRGCIILKMVSLRVLQKAERFRSLYFALTGEYARQFFCPLVRRDEDVALCEAHILNKKLPKSSRKTTIQRLDVDGFYGSHFESRFIDAIRLRSMRPFDVLSDSHLRNRYKPKLSVANKDYDYYIERNAGGRSPYKWREKYREVALKIKGEPPILEDGKNKASLMLDADFRIPAIVSLLKSAYLTLFEVMHYRYALSASGYFIGKEVLGDFFLGHAREKSFSILESAATHFAPFSIAVRSIDVSSGTAKGSIENGQFILCGTDVKTFWGCMVMIRIDRYAFAVLLPFFEAPDTVKHYWDFMSGKIKTIYGHRSQILEDRIEFDPSLLTIPWPLRGAL